MVILCGKPAQRSMASAGSDRVELFGSLQLHLGGVAGEILIRTRVPHAHVIGHEKNDVGLLRRGQRQHPQTQA